MYLEKSRPKQNMKNNGECLKSTTEHDEDFSIFWVCFFDIQFCFFMLELCLIFFDSAFIDEDSA